MYGKRVIPDSLCSLVNGAAGVLEHWAGVAGRSSGSAAEHSRQSLVTDVAFELERRCLRTEEGPTTTRFWRFEDCAQTLFRWKIVDLPAADFADRRAASTCNQAEEDHQGPEVFG